MDSMVEIYIERAKNETLTAESLKKLSEEIKFKENFDIPNNTTFYSSVISHSYYSIFYSAKAILLTKGIKTSPPNVHMETYKEFKRNFVDTGVLDKELLLIYNKIVIKADELLDIFKDEKWKRGNFTYNIIPQANKIPAEESLTNAKTFVANIIKVINSFK
ncbi:MAG: HEPN domain-containing protein [Nanoarchaeota archaeon]|nr:HEPN domain-containing protein [Nanoarchaeota archaeon]